MSLPTPAIALHLDPRAASTVVSRHRTSEGILIWTRDADGELAAVFEPYASHGDRYVVAGRRHPAVALAAD